MVNNANINARLADLLNILDMRTHISVYGIGSCGKQVRIFDTMPVYEVVFDLSSNDEYRKLRDYEVTAINAGTSTNILIKKGE